MEAERFALKEGIGRAMERAEEAERMREEAAGRLEIALARVVALEGELESARGDVQAAKANAEAKMGLRQKQVMSPFSFWKKFPLLFLILESRKISRMRFRGTWFLFLFLFLLSIYCFFFVVVVAAAAAVSRLLIDLIASDQALLAEKTRLEREREAFEAKVELSKNILERADQVRQLEEALAAKEAKFAEEESKRRKKEQEAKEAHFLEGETRLGSEKAILRDEPELKTEIGTVSRTATPQEARLTTADNAKLQERIRELEGVIQRLTEGGGVPGLAVQGTTGEES